MSNPSAGAVPSEASDDVQQAEAAARAQRKQRCRHSAVRQLGAPSADQGAVITPSPTGPCKRLS